MNTREAYQRIVDVLRESGTPAGQQHTGGGWSDDGPPPYQPAVQGWTMTHAERDGIHYHAVTWAGKGRKDGLERVCQVLEKAGLSPVMGPKWKYGKQQVVIVTAFPFVDYYSYRYAPPTRWRTQLGAERALDEGEDHP